MYSLSVFVMPAAHYDFLVNYVKSGNEGKNPGNRTIR